MRHAKTRGKDTAMTAYVVYVSMTERIKAHQGIGAMSAQDLKAMSASVCAMQSGSYAESRLFRNREKGRRK